MRGLAFAGALIVAALLAGVARAVQPPIAPHVVARVADARPVTVQLTVATFPLVCGRPSGTLVVALPAALAAPRAIAPRAVVVNGRRSSKVTVAARTVSIVPARSSGVSCMSIVEGPLKIGFARTAGLRSSTAPGRYAVTLRRGTESYRATLDIAG